MKKIFAVLLILIISSVCFADTKRVFFNPDGTVAIRTFVWELKKADETDTEFMNRLSTDKRYIEYRDIPKSELPDTSLKNKWRWNMKDKIIIIDHSVITKQEQITGKKQAIDMELLKSNPNLNKVIKLMRDIEKIKGN